MMMAWYIMEQKFWYIWNVEDARMEWKTIFHTSIPIPYYILSMVHLIYIEIHMKVT